MRKCSHYIAVAILLILLVGLTIVKAQTETPGVLNKTPFEQIDASIDFTQRASMGVTLSSVTAFNMATNRDDTASVIAGSPAPTVTGGGKIVQFRLKGGNIGQRFNIKCQVTKADTGEKLEGNLTLIIVAQQ